MTEPTADNKIRVAQTVAALATMIVLGLLVLTFQDGSWMLWADAIFGFIASGLFLLAFYSAKSSS